jgi:inorganic phosphate transporter, PiT family
MLQSLAHLGWAQILLLVASLGLAFAFEVVNGFHDTANAVATVIYTRSMQPTRAVIWSGLCNMLGIFVGGIGVAFSIVHLLPVDLLVHINTNSGLAMVLSLLGAALLWNFGTWYLGLPASSSHALIGSILGVGLANSWIHTGAWGNGINSAMLWQVGISLMISPVIGFALSALLLLWARYCHPDPRLHQAPVKGSNPPWWVRMTLIGTCTGVSFAHGSNDGQKGMGLVMLILIGVVPAQFALNLEERDCGAKAYQSVLALENFVNNNEARLPHAKFSWITEAQAATPLSPSDISSPELREGLKKLRSELKDTPSLEKIPLAQRWLLRRDIIKVERELARFEKKVASRLSREDQKLLATWHSELRSSVEYVPKWVILGVALSLGLGTMIGWKRVVVTIGEKIGKSHLTYSQGASAELVAMSTIGIADMIGLPVSTTHVLSSGVAGTMWANRSGINGHTVRSIALAWALTLPASMLLSASLLFLSRWMLG